MSEVESSRAARARTAAAYHAGLPLPAAARRVEERLSPGVVRLGLALSAACGRLIVTPRAHVSRRPAAGLTGDVAWFPLDCGLDGPGALLVPYDLGQILSDALLGGPGHAGDGGRLSLMETKVLARHLGGAVTTLTDALRALGVRHLTLGTPGEGTVAHLLSGRDVIVVEIEFVVGDVPAPSMLALAIPAAVSGDATQPKYDAGAGLDLAALAPAFAHVPFELRVTLPPTSLAASEVEQLTVGDVIHLDHSGEIPLLALFEGRVVLTGVLGQRGRHRILTVPAESWSPDR